MSVPPLALAGTVEVRVAQDTDNPEEDSLGVIATSGTNDLNLGRMHHGLRFTNIQIPP